MCSTRNLPRNLLFASLVGLTVVSTGCQKALTIPAADNLSAQPILVDGAMRQRDWKLSTALYESFSVEGRPTGFLWTQHYDDNSHYNGPGGEKYEGAVTVTDHAIFLADVVTLPIALLITPPWTPVESSGGPIPPTYTAAYPLIPIR